MTPPMIRGHFAIILQLLFGCVFLGQSSLRGQSENSELKNSVKTAFRQIHDGFSSDEVILDDSLYQALIEQCQKQHPDIAPWTFGWTLINLRKAGHLSDVPTTKRRDAGRRNDSSTTSELAIAEIVSRTLIDQHQVSIDRIMVTQEHRAKFNELAQAIAKDIDVYLVRKAAFRLRKSRRLRPELITRIADWGRKIQTLSIDEARERLDQVPATPGIYLFRNATGYLYIGESKNLKTRIDQHLDESSNDALRDTLSHLEDQDITIELHTFDPESRIKEIAVRRAYEASLIQSRNPRFNVKAK